MKRVTNMRERYSNPQHTEEMETAVNWQSFGYRDRNDYLTGNLWFMMGCSSSLQHDMPSIRSPKSVELGRVQRRARHFRIENRYQKAVEEAQAQASTSGSHGSFPAHVEVLMSS